MDASSTTNGNTASATLGDDARHRRLERRRPDAAGALGLGQPARRLLRHHRRRQHVGDVVVAGAEHVRQRARPAPPTPGISILGGFITIGSVTSTATATSDGTTGKVTGSTQVQNMDIAGEQVTVDANGISAAGQSTPTVRSPSRPSTRTSSQLGISIVAHQSHRHGQRPVGQPDARRAQDQHRPQDARLAGQHVRRAPAGVAHLAAPRRAAQRPAAHPRPGHRAGELDGLPVLRRRQQRQLRRGAAPRSTPRRRRPCRAPTSPATRAARRASPAPRAPAARFAGRHLGSHSPTGSTSTSGSPTSTASAPTSSVDRAGLQGDRGGAGPAGPAGRRRARLRLQARRGRRRGAGHLVRRRRPAHGALHRQRRRPR